MAIMTGIAWTSPVIRSGSEGESQSGARAAIERRRNGNERTNPFPTLPFFSRSLSPPFPLLRGKERARERQRVHYFCNEDHLGNDFFGLINELPTFSAKRRGAAGRAGRHARPNWRRRRRGGTPREFSQKKAVPTNRVQRHSSSSIHSFRGSEPEQISSH